LGLTLSDIVELIQPITRKHFHKSMTSAADTRIWQDVYHVPCGLTVLYVKFTTDAKGYLVSYVTATFGFTGSRAK
jgi:motility quorum-sensing regulator/GCU-specific mRNA interferase toxin